MYGMQCLGLSCWLFASNYLGLVFSSRRHPCFLHVSEIRLDIPGGFGSIDMQDVLQNISISIW